MISFPDFFQAIHGFAPFPWQRMLAEHVACEGAWPRLIDLPTASGKTAAIDVAVWALANEAHLPAPDRRMPCRVWFVVDRRIVVDEAAERAGKIQQAILTHPSLADVREALRGLSGTALPLAVDRLRGGQPLATDSNGLPNDAWQHVPSQPAVITSTVDQIGSRLLFRGYGMGRGMWPVHAALAGNDSLILLDEAHIAEPMRQTLTWIDRHRRAAKEPVITPWQFSIMTATPQKVASEDVFPRAEDRAAALDHVLLHERRAAAKLAKLILAEKPKGKSRKRETLVPEALAEARQCLLAGCSRIAVMVNRIDTALTIHETLQADRAIEADVRLLIGRMRPADRAALLGDLEDKLAAQPGGQPTLERPIVLVTTQCLEVGADFDFDGLVTECGSLDALRQRFGRLNRLGCQPQTCAAVLAWRGDVEAGDDPIYGPGLGRTWNWLNTHATERDGDVSIDFGINSLDVLLESSAPDGGLAALLAPKPNAPVLMPAYLDAWCQREPAVEPDVSLFLHGIRETDPEVSVVFRADLAADAANDAALTEAVRLVPPTPGEMLPVRLGRLLGWLAHNKKLPTDTDLTATSGGDVAAERTDVTPPQRFVRYRGQRNGETTALPADSARRELRPGDVVVLPWSARELPAVLGSRAANTPVDCFETVHTGRPIARLTPALIRSRLSADADNPATDALIQRLRGLLGQLVDPDTEDDEQTTREALRDLAFDPQLGNGKPFEVVDIVDHPLGGAVDREGGVVLLGTRPEKRHALDPFSTEDEASCGSRPVELGEHARQVAGLAAAFAERCLPKAMEALYRQAGERHDDGKADPRFQALLRGGSVPLPPAEPELLAKSDGRQSPARQRALRDRLGLPATFRHEMLSMQFVEQTGEASDLLLHLIASHHGHARPFAPVAADKDPPDVMLGRTLLTTERREQHPAHAIGSGIADRFWRLTRSHGWWGLAYLEAILRLADQHASRFPDSAKEATHD